MYPTGVKIFLLGLLAVLPTNIAAQHLEVGTMRIFGGEPITIDKAPYIMQLRDKDNAHYCGGTLVAKRYVVTAAHCLNDKEPNDLIVVGGATTVSEVGVPRNVVQIFIHDKYVSSIPNYDVAVLKLDADMEGVNIATMALCDQELQADDMVEVSGWGLIATNSTPSYKLLTISIPVASKESCTKSYRRKSKPITDVMFCASQPGLKDSCNQDSGGPAIYDEQLCGIVSWGLICGDPEYPGVYTDVLKVRDFIEAAMKK